MDELSEVLLSKLNVIELKILGTFFTVLLQIEAF